MPVLNKQLLNALGIDLSDEEYSSLENHAEATLHDRVIEEIVKELTPEQATELSDLKNADDEVVGEWMLQNVDNLQEIVSDEIDILLGDLAEDSSKI